MPTVVKDEPGYCNSRDTVVEVLLKDADEVEARGMIAKASCYRAAANTIAAMPTDPFDQEWLKNCAAKADGFVDGLRAAARIVDAYGKAAHGQSLKDMAPIISKSILRVVEAEAEQAKQEPCDVCGSTDDGCDEDIPSLRHCPRALLQQEGR